MLADPNIDAVVLCTPHSQHAAEVIAAAKAGKHVFCEKPFTLTRGDAEAAIAACKAAGVTLHVGFNRRYAPAYLDMKRRIDAGEIGQVRHIEGQFSGPPSYQIEPGNWRSNQIESPGGSMTARGVHVIDSMVAIAGLVETVFAFSGRLQLDIDVDDTTSCLLRFKGGVTGYLGTLHATSAFYRIHVFGSKGALEMRGETELLVSDLKGNVQRIALRRRRQGTRGAGGFRRCGRGRREIRDRAGGDRQYRGGDGSGDGVGAQRQGGDYRSCLIQAACTSSHNCRTAGLRDGTGALARLTQAFIFRNAREHRLFVPCGADLRPPRFS